MSTIKYFDVSVVVTTFNGAKWIENSVQSILDQNSISAKFIIVVDDCSTDDTCERVREINDDRIRIVRLESNSGVSVARNRGLAEAKTEWVAFHDQDDAWLPDKLLRQVQLLEQHPDASAVVGGEARLASDGRTRWSWGVWPVIWSPEHLPKLINPPFYNPMTDGGVYTQSMIVKTKVATDIEGFKTSLAIAEDTDFIWRFFEKTNQIVAVEGPVFLYRLGDHSTTAPGRLQAKAFLASRAYVYAAHRARLAGETEPDPKFYTENYIPSEDEYAGFILNQEMRQVNTIWVNLGILQAIWRFFTRSLLVPGVYRYALQSIRRVMMSK
jgi:glycosyltransferase involved in cell wall biosynthesis